MEGRPVPENIWKSAGDRQPAAFHAESRHEAPVPGCIVAIQHPLGQV